MSETQQEYRIENSKTGSEIVGRPPDGPVAKGRELLTNSRATSFKRCRRRHWYEYEQRLRPEEESKALRMGSAVHAGLDVIKTGGSNDSALDAVDVFYATIPEAADEWTWEIERTTVLCLVSGWAWRWGDRGGLDVIASESKFQMPLRNPATGAATPNFDLAGKQDGIVRLDSRKAVLEHKTCSEDIDESSGYWQRLQMDCQISLYVHAARESGQDVSGVLYDVIRKPTIRPEGVPITDDDGVKIVLDQAGQRVRTKDGKKWRETGSTADGWVLQSRKQTPAEWGEKLTADIAARPDYYYARREIARLDSEIEEAMEELWDVQKTLAEAKLRGRWYRTVSRDTCPYCPFFGICSSKTDVETTVPLGFVRVDDPHQELLA